MNQKNNEDIKIKSPQKLLESLLHFHPLLLSGISLLGMILYFIYFGFEVGNFPSIDGSEVIYIGILFFAISTIIFLIMASPIFLYPSYHNKKKPYSLIYKVCVYSMCITLVIIAGYFFCQKNYLFGILSIIVLLAIYFFYFYGIKQIYDSGDFKYLVLAVLIVGICYSPVLFTSQVASWFEISNVNYKYLVIEKGALGAISDKIYQNGKNIGKCKTYYEEDKVSGTIKLYDIKALSTLGKFYYLEAIGCENNEKIRFELDASKIISRKK